MYTKKPTYKILIVGCDNAGENDAAWVNQEAWRAQKYETGEKFQPTIGLNID